MNILLIEPIPPALGGVSFGGIATHIEGLSNALANKKHSVNLWYHKPQKRQRLKRITVIPNSYLDYLNSTFLCLIFMFNKELDYLTFKQRLLLAFQTHRLQKILKQQEFNVIHIHSLHNTSAIALKYINKQILPPLVITDHGFWQDATALKLNSNAYKKIKTAAAQCNELIYISNYAKQQHLKIDFEQYNKLVKIKNPIVINNKVIKPMGLVGKRTIFFNGLTESLKIKQFDVLLKAVQEDAYLRNHIKVLAIVNKDAHDYVAQNNFNFDIELHTATVWANVKEMYLRSDVFVLPSKSESFGLAYLEALSFGLPIVAFEDVFNEFQSNIPLYIGESFNSKDETSLQLAKKIKNTLCKPFNYNAVYDALNKAYNWKGNIIHYERVYSGK